MISPPRQAEVWDVGCTKGCSEDESLPIEWTGQSNSLLGGVTHRVHLGPAVEADLSSEFHEEASLRG